MSDVFDTQICRECGCTDSDCSDCVERTGAPCFWAEHNLCSACIKPAPIAWRRIRKGEVAQAGQIIRFTPHDVAHIVLSFEEHGLIKCARKDDPTHTLHIFSRQIWEVQDV